MSRAKFLGQIGWLFYFEAEGIRQRYALALHVPLTTRERREETRLNTISRKLFKHAEKAGLTETGTDFVFSEEQS